MDKKARPAAIDFVSPGAQACKGAPLGITIAVGVVNASCYA
jgi:hypothetical protein